MGGMTFGKAILRGDDSPIEIVNETWRYYDRGAQIGVCWEIEKDGRKLRHAVRVPTIVSHSAPTPDEWRACRDALRIWALAA